MQGIPDLLNSANSVGNSSAAAAAMSREILARLNKARIEIASGTYEIVGVPPIKVELAGAS